MNEVPEAFVELGFQLGIIIGFWVTVILILTSVVFTWRYFNLNGSSEGWAITAFLSWLCAVIMIVIMVIVLIPFNSKYWHYYELEGEVTKVSNVISEASGDLTRKPVVEIEGMDRPVVVDDPRAIDLQGENVLFRCTIGWHYAAADTYDCRIVSY